MIYSKKRILLASKHEKEKVVAPIFKKAFDAQIFISDYDTDQLGTFTGEVPRLKDSLSTCKEKAMLATELLGHPYGLASEGSFGPHPLLPLFAYAEEWMVFVDRKLDICIAQNWTTDATNYQTKYISPDTDLSSFLNQVRFPSHALCLQTADLTQVIAKGIRSNEALLVFLKKGFTLANELLISTDMRAMMNPTRMQAIKKCAKLLVSRMQKHCPGCQVPGFGQQGVSGYLTCQRCHLPSLVSAFELWACVQCSYQEQRPRADGKVNIEPQYCQFCNP